MLRRLRTNKKSLVIIPLALVLALTWLFLPVKEVSIEPYGTLSLESRIVISVGYQAAYASPDTEILRPDAAGDYNQWGVTGATYDYEATSDELDTTDIYTGLVGERDLMSIQNHSTGSGTINSVTIWFRAQVLNGGSGKEHAATYINTNAQYYTGGTNAIARATAWGEYSEAYNTNPQTLQAWTWADVDALQAGVITLIQGGGEIIHVSKVWVVVDYTPEVEDISNTSATGNTYNFGNVAESSSTKTGLGYFEVTNNSPSTAVSITISGSDMTGGDTWALSEGATIGTNIYGLRAGLSGQVEGNDYTVIVPKSSANTLIGSLGAGSPQQWGLQFLAPDTFTDGIEKSGIVTLTAAF